MSKLNPIERSKHINNRYKEYLNSSFQFGNDTIQVLFKEQLEKEVLFKGPYVDLNLPFKRGKSINELIDDGVVSPLFRKLNSIEFTRPLYSHQEDAIRNMSFGSGAIVTTGTGSGKTECFLYPILNDILKNIENGNNDVGIRAIFLYPMNALVNDQTDRVREILCNYPEIKFGFFTGDTNEKADPASRKKYEGETGVKIPSNELITREEIRETPPHLLFTNYSMLEYLLIRPSDSKIFAPELLENWGYVVLDEAHSYYGSKGIELSMLMRRLTALADKKPRFILTSATLGKQNESEADIVKFANNLTSSSFKEKDIIFSKRIPLTEEIVSYQVTGSNYIDLKNNLANKDKIEEITNIYSSNSNNNSVDVKELIYDLLIRDENVYKIYLNLKNGCLTFYELLENLNSQLKDIELISLIELINYAEKNGIGIFDLKYHSFVRPLSGAYITLGEKSQLTLTKTNQIGDKKAFEIGNCRYCNSPYIIGRIQKNTKSKLSFLYQNSEVDMYENYGDNISARIDYFLIEKPINEEEVDLSTIEECEICNKCGEIHSKNNLNALKCDCSVNNRVVIYKVNQSENNKEDRAYNNIEKCACCGHKSSSGIVKNLNLGKDEGTALISQFLFEAIDENVNEEKREDNKKISLSLKPIEIVKNEEKKVKQFLSFSDSRQEASFSAVFSESNHTRMLQKRMIWQVIVDNNYEDINFDEAVVHLTKMIEENEISYKNLNSHKYAWITIMKDLLKVDGSYDGEGLGLYYFDLDLSEIESALSDEDVEEELFKYNLNKKELIILMQVVLGVFRVTPAVNYVKSTLMLAEKESLEYKKFDNYVKYSCAKSEKNIKSFIPIGDKKRNKVVRYVEKACNCSTPDAIELLNIIFNNLAVEISKNNEPKGILIKHNSEDSYQTNSNRYILRNYKSSKYYACSKCGRLTPYNVHDVCPQDNCKGILSEIDPDQILEANFYRKQYKTKKIENIVIKEHTAQLERKTAKQYQNDFKNKKINILSCSTTFEMGIDLGNLETVFMRNVPPSPANYVQRAGRAGRRKDNSAYVLTYCNTGSHDYTYFNEPERMISGIINPPYFNVLNKKIIRRHLMATSLGFFFRNYPEYFKTIDALVFQDGYTILKNYLSNRPRDVIKYIDNKVISESEYSEYHNFNWYDEIEQNDEKMDYFISSIIKMKTDYEEAKQNALDNDNFDDAKYFDKEISKLHNLRVIDSLSKYCVIPKYGFPIDIVELQTYKNGVLINKYDLTRDLRIAITEYAPDSEVIVDGEKYTSRYITLPRTGQFTKQYFCNCPICMKVNIFISNEELGICSCGHDLSKEVKDYFIEPIYGFKTGLTKNSPRLKPKKSYSGKVIYLGGGIKDEKKLNMKNFLIAESTSNDELLIVNKSYFYMCQDCGYSEIVKIGSIVPQTCKEHENYREFKCKNDKLELLKLGHKFHTDVVRLSMDSLNISIADSDLKALSTLYALLEGVSNGLEIERKDIDGIIEKNIITNRYDILLFDDVPGGAGHVKKLMNKDAIIISLKSALNKVKQDCCDEETTCYNCLRNYKNQSYHSILKRKFAKDIIEDLLISLI